MLVDAITQRDVVTVERDHTVLRVARLMKERNAGVAVVVDDKRRPIGVVTDRDVTIRIVAEGRSPETPVDEIMSHPVYAVSENSLVFDTLRAMARHHVHRLPVIDTEKRIVGVVNISDALMLLTAEQANVAEVLGGRREGGRS
jgi:signal-transduction protein with cAMP-binding, CBS, and nucleotidyltransferase domain